MKYVNFSLDTELAWGFSDLGPGHPTVDRMRNDPSNVRDAYRTLIDAFDRYEIPATWAVVGHLLLEECDSTTHHTNGAIEAGDPFGDQRADPVHYAPDLVEWISNAAVEHDVGSHSFSHPEFSSLSAGQAYDELSTVVELAADRGIDLRSFVFPRNNVAHVDVLSEFGIDIYRTTTVGENHTFKSGAVPFVTGDSAFWSVPPVRPERDERGLATVRASRLLHEVRWCYLHPWRIRRTIGRMDDGEVMHFAFHPHDLLTYYRLDWVLDRTLRVVDRLRDRGDLEVATMADLADLV